MKIYLSDDDPFERSSSRRLRTDLTVMTKSVVGPGVNGGLITSDRPSQKGDLHLWVPKKDTHTQALGSGEFSLYVHNGVDSAGVSSSEIITTTDDGADLAGYSIVGPYFDPVAESGGPSSDLVGFTLQSSNPVRSASEALLLASTSH